VIENSSNMESDLSPPMLSDPNRSLIRSNWVNWICCGYVLWEEIPEQEGPSDS